jgi:hypothetical protein
MNIMKIFVTFSSHLDCGLICLFDNGMGQRPF